MTKMLEMREAKAEERKAYYSNEWSQKDLPDYLLHTLSLREFGFDHEGEGPNDRYNQFMTITELSDYLKKEHPYAVYSSVALYERPSERKKWLKSELAFDIDAKDLPFKSCDCTGGNVCEICLEEARSVAASFGETLSSDLGLENIHFIYSGRGFHIRVFDDSIMGLDQNGRSQIVEYITGGVIPTDSTLSLGYSRVFRKRALRTLKNIDRKHLLNGKIPKKSAKRIMEEKKKVMNSMKKGNLESIKEIDGIGKKSFNRLLKLLSQLNREHTDGKVTVDKKRILRVPSSLHSTVSRKCIQINNIDNFSLEETVPQFLEE